MHAALRKPRPLLGSGALLLVAALALPQATPLPTTPPSAQAGSSSCDRYASPKGSNRAPGTRARPVRSAPVLLERLQPYQRGCFRAGHYNFGQLAINKPGITLAPAGKRAHAHLNGEVKVLPDAKGAALVRLALNGAGGTNEIGPRIHADGVLLRRNRITNRHRGVCIQIGPFFDRPPPVGVRILGNRIHRCGARPATNHHHGIYVGEAYGTTIRNNWIFRNADRGIQLYPSARETKVVGNVIDGNGQGIVIGGNDSGNCSRDNIVARNVLSHPRISWNVYSGAQGRACSGNVVARNCTFAGAAEERYRVGGGIQDPSRSFDAFENTVARPRYVDAAAGDYRLRRRSRCTRVTSPRREIGNAARVPGPRHRPAR